MPDFRRVWRRFSGITPAASHRPYDARPHLFAIYLLDIQRSEEMVHILQA